MLVPLSVFFAVSGTKEKSLSDAQRLQIDRWFWRTAFSRRYSSGVIRNLNTDIAAMTALRDGAPSELGNFDADVDAEFFTRHTFGIGNVNTKTLILMLALQSPRSFVSGAPVDLAATLKAANRAEFHHLMPRNFLRTSKQDAPAESALVNFAFLSRSDNRDLGGDAPSVYRVKMPKDAALDGVLTSALVPHSLFADDYAAFAAERSALLVATARALTQVPSEPAA